MLYRFRGKTGTLGRADDKRQAGGHGLASSGLVGLCRPSGPLQIGDCMTAQEKVRGQEISGVPRGRVVRIICAIGLVVIGGVIVGLISKRDFSPSIQLPTGHSLTEVLQQGVDAQPAGWHTNFYCLPSQPRPSLGLKEDAKFILREAGGKIHEWRGQTLLRAPQLPTTDCLTPRLGECHQNSGEIYLLAVELDTERSVRGGMIDLCFVWGAPNQLRHAREWNAMIEHGICNGVFERELDFTPKQRPSETWGRTTNLCAIVRDQPGFVKIVPLRLLKAYVNSGLISQPGQAKELE